MTVNISGSLIEEVAKIKNQEFFSKIKVLATRGQIELTNSPIYHPLLPLTPTSEIETQLTMDREVHQKFLGTPVADIIFPPELAVDGRTLKFLGSGAKNNGLTPIIIIDESSVNPGFSLEKLPSVPFYKMENATLAISSRAITEMLRSGPKDLTAEKFTGFLEALTSSNPTHPIISVSDAELFGHHYKERINLLKNLMEKRQIEFVKLSTLSSRNTSIPVIGYSQINPSTWQTTKEDLKSNNPFSLWSNPNNMLQNLYLELCDMAFDKLRKPPKGNLFAEGCYHRGISSCHLYWLSNWPWWHPDLVENGATELIKCLRSLSLDTKERNEAEDLYHKFLIKLWNKHWSGEVETRYEEYNKYREEFIKTLPI